MSFDIAIKNAMIIDGTANPMFRADVGIHNGLITKIGKINNANRVINANQHIICPGFIDPHSHSDRYISIDPYAQSTIRQGITTMVVGQCGISMAPLNPETQNVFKHLMQRSMPPGYEFKYTWNTFTEYLAEMDKIGCASNIIPVVGFSPVRIAGGPGFDDRVPTEEELDAMRGYVREAMEAGAFGFSTGLIYTPQTFAKLNEIIELVKIVTQYDGLYFTHMRNEGAKVIDGINECIEIVEQSGVRGAQIAHHKIAHRSYWGLSQETLELISEANKRGLDITVDQYPYNRSQTSLVTAIPPWAHDGGTEKLLERLQNPDDRNRIKQEIEEGLTYWSNLVAAAGYDGVYLVTARSENWSDVEGKSLAEITKLRNYPDDFTTLCEILIDAKGEVTVTCASIGEEDIHRIMQNQYQMIGSDGWSVAPTGILSFGNPHPRLYGTYPRVLRKYVREDRVLSIEDAIRRMTSFPAQKLRLFDRGLLREGMRADVVVFDPETIQDKATFQKPHQFAEGIPYVIVNGELVIDDNQQTKLLPGLYLRRPQ